MSRWRVVALGIAIWLVASLSAGAIGAGVATVLVTKFANNQNSSPSDAPDWEEFAIESEALGESRHVTVHFPDFYARDLETGYPVWVVLDGTWNGPISAEVARTFDRADLSPGHLVVGVENVPRGRNRDLLPPGVNANGVDGGADAFLAFIETELLPEIEARYRTTGVRLLSGHSLGGLFVGYALDERPDLFDGWFAFSPSYWAADGAEADRVIAVSESDSGNETVYLNIGDETGPMRTHFDRVAEAAGGLPRWTAEVVPGASHGATLRLSSAAALRAHYVR